MEGCSKLSKLEVKKRESWLRMSRGFGWLSDNSISLVDYFVRWLNLYPLAKDWIYLVLSFLVTSVYHTSTNLDKLSCLDFSFSFLDFCSICIFFPSDYLPMLTRVALVLNYYFQQLQSKTWNHGETFHRSVSCDDAINQQRVALKSMESHFLKVNLYP